MAPDEVKKDAQQEEAQASADKQPADSSANDEVKTHDLTPLNETANGGESGNIDLLLDVTVPVVAQLGTTEMRIGEILKLVPGSIIELNKLAGEPVDLYVRGKLIAQGEVVVVDENFGVRMTQIVSPKQGVEALTAS